jgi:hypothetical protein
MSNRHLLQRAALAVAPAILLAASTDARSQEQPAQAAIERPGANADAPPAREEPGSQPADKGYAVELGGQVTYVSTPIRGATDPFGAGFGGRIGVVVGALYFGARVTDFLGGRDVDVSYRALLLGAEVGYGLRFPFPGTASFVLRPQMGAGNAAIYYTDPALSADVVTSASGRTTSSSDTLTVNALYIEPGLAAILASGSHFVSVRTSALVIPSITYGGADATNWVSYGIEGQLGFVF